MPEIGVVKAPQGPVGAVSRTRATALVEIQDILNAASAASSGQDFFDLLRKLIVCFSSLPKAEASWISNNRNLYAEMMARVFLNPVFSETLIKVVNKESAMYMAGDHISSTLHRTEKQLIHAGVMLSFFPVAMMLDELDPENITFIRRHITRLIGVMGESQISTTVSFESICFGLEEILKEPCYEYRERYKEPPSDSFYRKHFLVARSLAASSILILTIPGVLRSQFSKAVTDLEKERNNLSLTLSEIYGGCHRIEKGIDTYKVGLGDEKEAVFNYIDTFTWNNERNLIFFIKLMTSGFQFQPSRKFLGVLDAKVDQAAAARHELQKYARKHLKAFTQTLGEKEYEWSNKIFIISIRTHSVLEELSKAEDASWRHAGALNELILWVQEVHSILNKFRLEDQFNIVASFLRDETVQVEWKSTLYTPTENDSINPQADAAKSKDIFMSFVKAILGMLNTEGGTILVGVVEHPERITRSDIRSHMLEKKGTTFFDVGFELKHLGKNEDGVRLQLTELLCNITGATHEKFNNLIAMEPILIRNTKGDAEIKILKVTVTAAQRPFFNVKEENGTIWLSLTKRAENQTIDVDIREYVEI